MVFDKTCVTSRVVYIEEIIDRYNSGRLTEYYLDDLVNFANDLRDEEMRAAREGLNENELEIFDLLKKENLTKPAKNC